MNKLRNWALILFVLAVASFGLLFLAASGEAHDAPPQGSSTCTDTDNWAVNNGMAVTENTGGTDVVVTISSSAGTVTQSDGSVKGDGKQINYKVAGIPIDTASITVTSTTTWDKGTGVDHHNTVINRPESGCTGSIPIPATPSGNPATCTAPGSLYIPANDLPLKWTKGPLDNQVTVHIAGGYNDLFSDGTRSHVFTEDIQPQLDAGSDACATVVSTPADLEPALATCTANGFLDIPANTDSIKYTVNGEKLNDGLGDTVGPGTYYVVYHTTYGNILSDGTHSHAQTVVVASKLDANSAACKKDEPTPTPTKTVPVPPKVTPTNHVVTHTVKKHVVVVPVSHNTPTATANTGPKTVLGVVLGAALLIGGLTLMFLGRRPRGARQ